MDIAHRLLRHPEILRLHDPQRSSGPGAAETDTLRRHRGRRRGLLYGMQSLWKHTKSVPSPSSTSGTTSFRQFGSAAFGRHRLRPAPRRLLSAFGRRDLRCKCHRDLQLSPPSPSARSPLWQLPVIQKFDDLVQQLFQNRPTIRQILRHHGYERHHAVTGGIEDLFIWRSPRSFIEPGGVI